MKKYQQLFEETWKSGTLSTEQYKKIKAVGSRTGILYGFVKYVKPLLIFVHHLGLYFLQLELLVTNLQSF